MNAAALWLRDFPTHGLLSFKTDRSLPPFNAEESWPRKKKKKEGGTYSDKRQMSSLELCCAPPCFICVHGPTAKLGVSSPPRYARERASCAFTPGSPQHPTLFHPTHLTSPQEQHYTCRGRQTGSLKARDKLKQTQQRKCTLMFGYVSYIFVHIMSTSTEIHI